MIQEIELINLYIVTFATSIGLLALVWFVVRQRQRDKFEEKKWNLEMKLREQEMDMQSSVSDEGVYTANSVEGISYGGYVFVDVPDENKGLFHDTIKGFDEYAKLKGYQVGISVDTTLPGKVGFKFTVLDRGVTVSTEKVRSDVDEYINKFRNEDNFSDLPIIVDVVEHERLKAALSARFTMVRANAEMHKTAAEFYKQIAVDMRHYSTNGVGYVPAQPMIIQNTLGQGETTMSRDTYTATDSPAATVGNNNKVSIKDSAIVVGSTLKQRNEQVGGISQLIELVASSEMKDKDDAVRHLINAREELTEGNPPDSSLVERFLDKAKAILSVAKKGTDLYDKAKEIFTGFNLTFS